jgi:hypothetical protein
MADRNPQNQDDVDRASEEDIVGIADDADEDFDDIDEAEDDDAEDLEA